MVSCPVIEGEESLPWGCWGWGWGESRKNSPVPQGEEKNMGSDRGQRYGG